MAPPASAASAAIPTPAAPALASADGITIYDYGAQCPSGTFWVYAKSPNKAVAGDMFAYLGSAVGQLAFQTLSGAPQASIYPAVNAHV